MYEEFSLGLSIGREATESDGGRRRTGERPARGQHGNREDLPVVESGKEIAPIVVTPDDFRMVLWIRWLVEMDGEHDSADGVAFVYRIEGQEVGCYPAGRLDVDGAG